MSLLYKPIVSILQRANVYEKRELDYASTIISLLNNIQMEPILDVGTGGGHIADLLSRHGCNFVVGLDLDKDWIKSNKARLSHFILADAHQMPFRNKVFSVTLSISCIEHLHSPLTSINEIGRITKQRGVCIVQLPNIQWIIEPHTKFPLLYLLPKKLSSLIRKSTQYTTLNLDTTLKKVLSWFDRIGFVNTRRIKIHHVSKVLRLFSFPCGWFLLFLKVSQKEVNYEETVS